MNKKQLRNVIEEYRAFSIECINALEAVTEDTLNVRKELEGLKKELDKCKLSEKNSISLSVQAMKNFDYLNKKYEREVEKILKLEQELNVKKLFETKKDNTRDHILMSKELYNKMFMTKW